MRSMYPTVLTASLAISTSLRAAAAGSVRWVGSTNFMGTLLSISKNFNVSKLHGKTRDPSQACSDVWSD